MSNVIKKVTNILVHFGAIIGKIVRIAIKIAIKRNASKQDEEWRLVKNGDSSDVL